MKRSTVIIFKPDLTSVPDLAEAEIAALKAGDFPNQYAADSMVYRMRWARAEPHSAIWAYWLGKQYEAEKKIYKRKEGGRTKDRMQKEYGVAPTTIERSVHFMKGLDYADSLEPGMRDEVLYGDLKNTSRVTFEELSKKPENTARAVIKKLKKKEPAREVLSKPVPEIDEVYNADDMLEMIRRAGANLHVALNQGLVVMHSEVLKDKAGRKKIKAGLQEIIDDIKNYMALTL